MHVENFVSVIRILQRMYSFFYLPEFFIFDLIYQYMVLDIWFWSVKYTVATRLRKHFEQLFVPIEVMQGDYSLLI